MVVRSSILVCLLLVVFQQGFSSVFMADSLKAGNPEVKLFYDSLKIKASRHGFTRLMYAGLVREKRWYPEMDEQLQNLMSQRGKTIAAIHYKGLDVFGPTLRDTSRVTDSKLAAFANRMHTKTSMNIIRKNVLLEVGDTLDVAKVMDNERIIRLLPYIKDVRFLVSLNPDDSTKIDLTVLTKDVFSFGIGSHFDGIRAGSLEMYNKNIWGAGHQISAKIVGHVDREPYVGFEGFYKINNINGNFVNLAMGYANNYRREGFLLSFEKEFLRTSTKWGGGLDIYRLFNSDRLIEDDQVKVDSPLDYGTLDCWNGYAFQLFRGQPSRNMQLVLSGRVRHLKFFDRPGPGADNNQYFANSNFYLGSISLSKRNYIRDYLVYSYGITEDIPKGFLHEWVLGYDDNEFSKRWYSHLYFSSGNFIRYKPSYLFASVGIGGFFNSSCLEQGQLEFNGSYISRLFGFDSQKVRQFVRLKYLCGINRFEQENLFLKNNDGIRGFYSNEAIGQQRLLLSLETVFFQKREILNFNFAFFGFADLGIIGASRSFIFNENYYAGIGAGIRIRNENMVFRTLQLRLAFYPNHPADVGGFGFDFTEISKSSFYSFQPRKPETLRFR